MNIGIRPARPGDMAAITSIYADAVLNGTASYEVEPPDVREMESRFAAIRNAGLPFLVADPAEGSAGGLLGYAYVAPFRPRPAYRFIVENSVYVAPDAKRRGVGMSLLQRLIAEVERLGFRQIVAVIGDGSPSSPSVRLHRRAGFRYCGELIGSGYKHGRWLNTVFMQLALNGGSTAAPDPDSLPERRFQASGLDQPEAPFEDAEHP